jgi:hypothetical protein
LSIDDHAHAHACAAISSLSSDNPRIPRLGQETVDDDRVISATIAPTAFAVICKLGPSDVVRAYVDAGIAPATRRAYKADLDHFRAWGGDIPTTDIQLSAYLADQTIILKAATLTRRLAAISITDQAQRCLATRLSEERYIAC